MDAAIYEEMYKVEKRHWWFNARRRILIFLLNRICDRSGYKSGEVKICDIGCGTGWVLEELQEKYDAVGIESDSHAIRFCRQRGVRVFEGELPYALPFEGESFDVVLLLDVLEHIDNDMAAVKEAIKLLKKGGILICTMPAYQCLWTRHDELHHHRRRYNKKTAEHLLKSDQMEALKLSYYNFFLFPIAVVSRLVIRISKKNTLFEMKIPNSVVNVFLENVLASERFFIPYINFPLGLSLIYIGRKIV
ncbi:MAG TPA: class I SAM-dependent methyltransferase [Nitrospirae bacterium]|nr:class I SAM-dependent methyltransferase [Nitrospirota bacterium]